MLFNNLAQKRFETNKKYIFYSVNPDKHEKIHTNNIGEWGGGGYFILLRRNGFKGKS